MWLNRAVALGNNMAQIKRVVALVGGCRGRFDVHVEGVETRDFGSNSQNGNGELRRLRSTINAGQIQLIIQLTGFTGHSMGTAVASAAKKHGIEVIRCHGGKTGVERLIEQWVQRPR